MKRFLAGALGVLLAFSCARTARADPSNVCIELHCYCQGPDRADTVASCDTTCEAVCGGASAGGSQSASKGGFSRQRFSLGVLGGPGPRVVDTAGTRSEGKASAGVDARIVAGARMLLGVELSLGATFASVKAPHFGPGAQTMIFVPILFGVTSTPRLMHGPRAEARLDLGADLGFQLRLGCGTCAADHLGKNAFAYQLRAGLDMYFGANKAQGFGLDAVFMFGTEGNVHDQSSPSLVEVRPPVVLIRLAFIWRNVHLPE